MNITRRPDLEQHLLAAIIRSFDEPLPEFTRRAEPKREGIHLSDLLSVRQTFFKRVFPMPATADEALYFLAGRGHEDIFGRCAGLEPGEQRTFDGISYRPDFRWTVGEYVNVPTEMKTRRSNLAKPGEEPRVYDSYLEQLGGYCAFDDSQVGILIVFSLLEGRSGDPLNPTHPEVAVYAVEYTPSELARIASDLIMRRNSLQDAFDARSGATLPLCADWKCGKPKKTVTQKPQCMPCRREFASDYNVQKHSESTGHTVIPEVATWSYEPRCKWFSMCEPWRVDARRSLRA